jgi:CRP/FNR family transcriptional activator FtrB
VCHRDWSLTCVTPENLSRAFNTLKPYGVDVDGMTIQLTDKPALIGLAKPNKFIDDQPNNSPSN